MKPEDFNFVVNETEFGPTLHRSSCGHAGRAKAWVGYAKYEEAMKKASNRRCQICHPRPIPEGPDPTRWDEEWQNER